LTENAPYIYICDDDDIILLCHAYKFNVVKEYDDIVKPRPNPEGFVYTSWKEREGGGMEGRKQ